MVTLRSQATARNKRDILISSGQLISSGEVELKVVIAWGLHNAKRAMYTKLYSYRQLVVAQKCKHFAR